LALTSATQACSSTSTAANVEREPPQELVKNETSEIEASNLALAAVSTAKSNASDEADAVVCPEDLRTDSFGIRLLFKAEVNGTFQETDKNLRQLNLTNAEQGQIDALRNTSLFIGGREGILDFKSLFLIWVTMVGGDGTNADVGKVGKAELEEIQDFCCRNPDFPCPIEFLLPTGEDAGAGAGETKSVGNRGCSCPLLNKKRDAVAEGSMSSREAGLVACLTLVSFICVSVVVSLFIWRKGCFICQGQIPDQ